MIFIGSLGGLDGAGCFVTVREAERISSARLGRCQTLLRVRQILIKLSGCFVGTSSALAVPRLTVQHLSHYVPGCLVFMGHGTPSAVAGGSVA